MVFVSLLLVNFRDKFIFFVNVLLPIIFLLLFGAIFGGGGNRPQVAFYSDRELTFSDHEWKKLKSPPSLEEIKTIDADIVIVAIEGKVSAYVKNALATQTGEVEFFRLRYASAGVDKKVVQVLEQRLNVGRAFNELTYMILGVIAISFLSVGMNAGVRVFSDYVQYGLFKRFNVVPLNSLRLTAEIVGAQVITGLVSSFLLILASLFFFRVDLVPKLDEVPKFLFAVIASVLINFALGVAIALFFKRAAMLVSQVVYTIFIFFSGVYFPITFLPGFLQVASYFTTARYVHMLFQKVYGVNVITDGSFWFVCVVFATFGLLIAAGATRKFLKQEA